jgi:hypothetical protein
MKNYADLVNLDQTTNPESGFITFHTQTREDCIDRGIACVKYYAVDPNAVYEMFCEYERNTLTDEVCLKQPISQRVIGAHDESYDYNFLLCRFFGFAKINPRVSHNIYGEYVYRFQLDDQQHAIQFEYDIVYNNKSINKDEFRKQLKSVCTENGVEDDNPIKLEIEQWIEQSDMEQTMNWSQVKNSVDDFKLLKEKMSEPIMFEALYSTKLPATNKTQKINDNPYGWKDWNKVRNQLTAKDELYKFVFGDTSEPFVTRWFTDEVKNNKFFSNDKQTYSKKQHFATNGQVQKNRDNGEVASMWFKMLFSFIDDDGNIDLKDPNMSIKTFNIVNDTSMYVELESIQNKWNKLSDNLKENKESILKLRKYFFEFFESTIGSVKNSKSPVAKYNKYLKTRGEQFKFSPKNVLNIIDLKLTKLENVIWIFKSCVVLSEKHSKTTIGQITKSYLNQLEKLTTSGVIYTESKKIDDDSSEYNLFTQSTDSKGRLPYLMTTHTKMRTRISKDISNDKLDTDMQLRNAHREIFSVAKENVGIQYDKDLYYFDPKSSGDLYDANTDLGHDLLKKNGRVAKVDTTFVQNRSENRKWNNGNFPAPADYYQGVLDTYKNMLENSTLDMKQELHIKGCYMILNEVVEMYKDGRATKIGKQFNK